jgi:hypothetical protein
VIQQTASLPRQLVVVDERLQVRNLLVVMMEREPQVA